MAEYTKIAENINTVGELVDALSDIDRDTPISLMGVDGFAAAKFNGEDTHVLMDEPTCIADLCGEYEDE